MRFARRCPGPACPASRGRVHCAQLHERRWISFRPIPNVLQVVWTRMCRWEAGPYSDARPPGRACGGTRHQPWPDGAIGSAHAGRHSRGEPAENARRAQRLLAASVLAALGPAGWGFTINLKRMAIVEPPLFYGDSGWLLVSGPVMGALSRAPLSCEPPPWTQIMMAVIQLLDTVKFEGKRGRFCASYVPRCRMRRVPGH